MFLLALQATKGSSISFVSQYNAICNTVKIMTITIEKHMSHDMTKPTK